MNAQDKPMNAAEERLLADLGQLQRDDQLAERRSAFDRVFDGATSDLPPELAALSEAERAELLAPLSDKFRQGLAARLVSAEQHQPRSASQDSTTNETTSRIRELRPSKRRGTTRRVFLGGAVGSVAMAAGVVLLLRTDPLPLYEFSVNGGDDNQRSVPTASEPPAVLKLSASSTLELRARPQEASKALISGSLWVKSPTDPAPVAVAAPPRVADSGAVRWKGSAAEWFGERVGLLDVYVLLGRKGHDAPPLLDTPLGSHSDYALFKTQVVVTP